MLVYELEARKIYFGLLIYCYFKDGQFKETHQTRKYHARITLRFHCLWKFGKELALIMV